MCIDYKYERHIKNLNTFQKNAHRLGMTMNINGKFKLVYPKYNDFFVKLSDICALKSVKEMMSREQTDFDKFIDSYKSIANETNDPFLLYIMVDLMSFQKCNTEELYNDLVTTLEKYKGPGKVIDRANPNDFLVSIERDTVPSNEEKN